MNRTPTGCTGEYTTFMRRKRNSNRGDGQREFAWDVTFVGSPPNFSYTARATILSRVIPHCSAAGGRDLVVNAFFRDSTVTKLAD